MPANPRQEKDRSSVGADSPVKTQNICGVTGYSDRSVIDRLRQDEIMWRAGYQQGLREGLAQGPAHPAVQQSVARMFGDWDGAEAAQQRSTQRFRNWYRKESDAA